MGTLRCFVGISAALIGAVLWTAGAAAQEQSSASVLLLRSLDGSARAWPAAEKALCEELSLLQISVETSDAAFGEGSTEKNDLDAALEESAHSSDARIAVTVSLFPGEPLRVEIRLYDHEEDSIVVKTWHLSDPAAPDAAAIAGIRGAEAIRAALRTNPEIANAASSAAPTPAAPAVSHVESQPAPETEAAERPSGYFADADKTPSLIGRFGLGAGVCMATSFESSGVQGGVLLTLDWRPLRPVGLVFDAIYLPWAKNISAGGVTSALDMALFRVQGVWQIRDRGKLRPTLGLGGGSLMVFAEGVSGDGRPLTKDLKKVGYLGGSAALGVIVVEWLRLEAVAGLGATLHAVRLHHGETEAARIGRPILDVSLRVEFGVF